MDKQNKLIERKVCKGPVLMTRVIRCPSCKVEVHFEDNPFRPFCSERCRLIDLGAWAEERYRIPGAKLEDETEREDDDPGDGST